MEQLKMYLLRDSVLPELNLPNEYTISRYSGETDAEGWIACCSDGNLIDNEHGAECFDNAILHHKYVIPTEDVFFIDYEGKHVGTATGYVKNISGKRVGDIHMVGVRKDFRGKGLSSYVVMAAIKHLREVGVDYISLTTDDFRLGAVKTYLRLGFKPVEYDLGMQDRWEKVLESIAYESTEMLYDDTSAYKTIYRRSEDKDEKMARK